MVLIDTVYDFSDKGLGELKAWLDPWFLSRCPCSADAEAPVYGSYEDVLRQTGGLVGYWKLDDALDFSGTFTTYAGDWRGHDNLDHSAYQTGVVMDSSGVGNHMDYIRSTDSTSDIDLAAGYADLPGGASPQGFRWKDASDTPVYSNAACDKYTAWLGITTPVKSVSFWFKTPETGTPQGFLVGSQIVRAGGSFGQAKGWAANLGGAPWGGTTGMIQVTYSDAGSSAIVLEGPMVANDTWYHLAITSDGTTNTLYVNGLNVDTYTTLGNILDPYYDIRFGIFGYKSGVQWLVGFSGGVTLDEIAMWTETVTEYWVGQQAHGATDTTFVLPDPLPVIPATPTAQDIADVLVELGLATQAP